MAGKRGDLGGVGYPESCPWLSVSLAGFSGGDLFVSSSPGSGTVGRGFLGGGIVGGGKSDAEDDRLL